MAALVLGTRATHRWLTRFAVAGWLLTACADGSGPPPPQASNFQALHAFLGGPTLNAVVDGRSVASNLTFGQLTKVVSLSPGQHTVVMQPPDTTRRLAVVFTTTGGVDYTAFVIDSLSGLNAVIDPVLVLDTGSVPAPGHGRLRLADFAAAAPVIDAYRSEPDSTGLLATARPFTFRATTPYFESTPGSWTVVISHRAMRDTLLATGSIAVADGQAWTVALVDSMGGRLSWRLVPDRD